MSMAPAWGASAFEAGVARWLERLALAGTGAAGSGGLAVTDPATDERLAIVPQGAEDEARAAVDAAEQAAASWRTLVAEERGRLLERFAARMLEEQESLAALLTAEQGKPWGEAAGEIRYAASFLRFAAGEAERIYGDLVPASHANQRILVLRQPVGIAAIVTPWNFPAAMITRKLGPALAAGCTAVVKPAEQTPLTALALGWIAREVGFPEGVVNIVTGDAEPIVDTWLRDARVRKLSFTGSTEVGRLLMAKAATNLTRLSLELGGHAPFLVFDDADLDAAVEAAVANKFRNAGQTCICANRFYVQAGVYEEFLSQLAAKIRALRAGRGNEPGVAIGPLIDDAAIAKVEAHVEDALSRGARLRAGGDRLRLAGLANRFYAPTLLDGLTAEMRVSQEETFGPVCPVARFVYDEEAVEQANASPYGLAAYFFTKDASRLMRVAEALEYGVIGANDGAPSTAQAPFGGMKHSGFGREGGRYAMEDYLETKYVSWRVQGAAGGEKVPKR
jgi:succinate-semialdehyde dehydrogenase/glutarate-semialdehyde dehydrogenase